MTTFRNMIVVAVALAGVAMAAASPATAIAIHREQQLTYVTPAMMNAINTIVAEKMRMSHMRRRHH